MLINCSECGKQVSDKASNCPSCGNPISVNSESKIFCTECGKQISEKDVVCPFCGNPAKDSGNINGNKSFERNIANGKEAFEKRIDEYKAKNYVLEKRSGDTVEMYKLKLALFAIVMILGNGILVLIVFLSGEGIPKPFYYISEFLFILFGYLFAWWGRARVKISLTQTGRIEETGNILK